jgi:hypothetical protein
MLVRLLVQRCWWLLALVRVNPLLLVNRSSYASRQSYLSGNSLHGKLAGTDASQYYDGFER